MSTLLTLVAIAALAAPASAKVVSCNNFVSSAICNNFVSAALEPAGLTADATELLSNELMVGGTGDVDITFTYISDTGSFTYFFGFCLADDLPAGLLASVTADGATSDQQRDFAKACVRDNGKQIFQDSETPESVTNRTFTVQGGSEVIFYLEPNGNGFSAAADDAAADDFWAGSARKPLFSVSGANPGELDQLVLFTDGDVTLFGWEDKTRNGESDADFSDLVFTVDVVLDEMFPVDCPGTQTFTWSPDGGDIDLTVTGEKSAGIAFV